MGPRTPTAFVSYSWDGEAHQAWVLKLASDLRANGVDATLDRWDLEAGDRTGAFMERAVRSDFVVMVCTRRYAAKANARAGGVGYEYTIITGDLLANPESSLRIVPILREGSPSEALPLYLRDRLFIDFTDATSYESALEQLLRRVFGAPALVRPALGQAPRFESPPSESSPPAHEPTPPSRPARWVLVAGTGRLSAFTEQERQTAVELGKALADGGSGLVTGGWSGVDDAVARSFAAELASRNRALEDYLIQVIAADDLPSFPAGNLILVRKGREEWTEAIARADAVILIGGIGGTWKTGELALEAGKVVLPLADTGGDAKKMYLHLLRHWNESGVTRISREQFQVLGRPAPAVARDVLQVLGRTLPAERPPEAETGPDGAATGFPEVR